MSPVLVIDNYDSFVHNLARYVRELGREALVVRNDAISLAEIGALSPSHIVISPGPCTPLEAGVSNDVIARFASAIPILGVCLGHQCIGHVFGGKVVRAQRPIHGKTSRIRHDGSSPFEGVPQDFAATRYHSLVVEGGTLPPALCVTARAEDNEIMAIRHVAHPCFGVQFHPESVLTEHGHRLIENFLAVAKPARMAS